MLNKINTVIKECGKIHWPKPKEIFVTTKNVVVIVALLVAIILAFQYLLSIIF